MRLDPLSFLRSSLPTSWGLIAVLHASPFSPFALILIAQLVPAVRLFELAHQSAVSFVNASPVDLSHPHLQHIFTLQSFLERVFDNIVFDRSLCALCFGYLCLEFLYKDSVASKECAWFALC